MILNQNHQSECPMMDLFSTGDPPQASPAHETTGLNVWTGEEFTTQPGVVQDVF